MSINENYKYIVRLYSRGMNIPSDKEFDTYKEAKAKYDSWVDMYYGDVEVHLIKLEPLEFSPYDYGNDE